MLATPADPARGLPATAPRWAYEVKWDGMRVLADLHDGRCGCAAAPGATSPSPTPSCAGLVARRTRTCCWTARSWCCADGIPSFAALAERMHVRDARRAAALAAQAPATLIVFDVLRLYGVDLTGRPWHERREALERLGPAAPAVAAVSRCTTTGRRCSTATREHGLEGVVAKRRSSRYLPGRASPRLGQGGAPPHPGLRWSAAGGRRRTARTRSARCCSASADADGAPARSPAGSGSGLVAAGRAGRAAAPAGARWPGRPRRSTDAVPARGRPRHAPGSSRRSSSRSVTSAAPRPAGCGSRCSAASAPTSTRPTPWEQRQ